MNRTMLLKRYVGCLFSCALGTVAMWAEEPEPSFLDALGQNSTVPVPGSQKSGATAQVQRFALPNAPTFDQKNDAAAHKKTEETKDPVLAFDDTPEKKVPEQQGNDAKVLEEQYEQEDQRIMFRFEGASLQNLVTY